MSDRITVNFDHLEGLVGRLGSNTDEIEWILQDLDSQLGQLRSEWSGDASDAHTRAHDEWAKDLAAMNAILRDLSVAISEANGTYRDAESRAAKVWH